MAAGKESQVASLTASIDEVTTRLKDISETIETHLTDDLPTSLQNEIKAWGQKQGFDAAFSVASRYVALNVVVKGTLTEWYAHRGDLPIQRTELRAAFQDARTVTENAAFRETLLDEVAWQLPEDIVAELSWWRHGVLSTPDPADDIGQLFEALIPAEERDTHGQFRTPPRISAIMRELAVSEDDRVLDAGMGAGALSVPRDEAGTTRVFGVEQSRLGFLLAVTTLAVADQPGEVHEQDFFDIHPGTLGMNADAALGMGTGTGDVDIVPGEVDTVLGNPPYVANRNLERDTEYYREHLRAFGAENQTPYLDGETKLSGRSDLYRIEENT